MMFECAKCGGKTWSQSGLLGPGYNIRITCRSCGNSHFDSNYYEDIGGWFCQTRECKY